MCGIAGVLGPPGIGGASPQELAGLMAGTLSHRGPDDEGVWADPSVGVAFGHRRLSVVDLSVEGRQPMRSADGRYVLSFNGEIYNHPSLRADLERTGHRFRGRSDTEVLLAAIACWGLTQALTRANGMFALSLWDSHHRVIHLARDRIGEKPLYYGQIGRSFVFASELKALRVCPGFSHTIDRDSLAAFFRFRYVPSPRSIYEGVMKLPAGSFISIRAPFGMPLPDPIPYWDASVVVADALRDPFRGSVEEAVDELDATLRRAVGIRMQADVPLGAFLSGGVDSSTVVALMRALSSTRIRTFTIGFTDPAYDESKDAMSVARHLGTDHTELVVSPLDAMEAITRLPQLYDEPFADSSQIPTYLVSKLARTDVTVSLSGDGGDELFGGYNRHLWVRRIHDSVGWVPPSARRVAARSLLALRPNSWQRVFDRMDGALPRLARHRMAGDKVYKLAGVLDSTGVDDMYVRLVAHWRDPSSLVIGGRDPGSLEHRLAEAPALNPVEKIMFLDLVTYLPDDILTKVDRASMGVSLEARLPLLDPEVVSLAWRLPTQLKVRGGVGKWCLRQVLGRYVPAPLIDRPKMGFGVPIHDWLRGPLRGWAESLLQEGRLAQEGYVEPDIVSSTWREHLSGRRNLHHKLWDVLMFESWLESTRASGSGGAQERCIGVGRP